ncbi:hypothetical protein C488_15202 [Natrinema pellirubrum DSM 15624]|uniref:Uncharacterized protein n=1 Tax=Natrinema pellirubrum (strain DSM 15624 / CIP 106293 / JCM 10476 / NCIMB 786 / 157) TaxID=797303 RepID=L0JMM5_NATP1|nr:DUF6516 family protein [Natrinema pellirubrum]AGB31812.1 hypothetical protein Natpe_1966 [Natrinema pellirubrum DSM 15624]ELY72269.1 hypothetical protein C488_15202 [Natrinema pellirubrum DSM 15624]
MASYTTIEDWQDVEDRYVIDVTIRQTEDKKYPCGWDYSLHHGEVGGDTILRYGNAHEQTKGHERHTRNGVEIIEFPGMLTLYDRFQRETEEMSPVSWNWSE